VLCKKRVKRDYPTGTNSRESQILEIANTCQVTLSIFPCLGAIVPFSVLTWKHFYKEPFAIRLCSLFSVFSSPLRKVS